MQRYQVPMGRKPLGHQSNPRQCVILTLKLKYAYFDKLSLKNLMLMYRTAKIHKLQRSVTYYNNQLQIVTSNLKKNKNRPEVAATITIF